MKRQMNYSGLVDMALPYGSCTSVLSGVNISRNHLGTLPEGVNEKIRLGEIYPQKIPEREASLSSTVIERMQHRLVEATAVSKRLTQQGRT